MQLALGSIPVMSLAIGQRTKWENGALTIGAAAASEHLREIPGVASAHIEAANPGEAARIIHALDSVEPRVRQHGAAYPGADGPVQMAGDGETLRLEHAAVIVSCEVPWRSRGGLLMAREGIIDMSGPGAMYSPFARTHNIVAVLELASDLEDEACEQATRTAGLRLAAHVAACVRDEKPTAVERLELPAAPGLPRVVYIYQVQSQALWARTFLYGYGLDDQLPVLLHPNEVLDGALVSGNQVYQNHKIPTWLHANNPVIRELYARHGRDLDFAGVILAKGYFYTDEGKHRSALIAARMAEQLGAAGAAVTWEGGGNSIVEAMLTVQACEQRGIRTTLIGYEMGSGGDRSPLIFSVPEADAIVSSANTEAPVRLPAMARVIGGDTIRIKPEVGGVHIDAAGPLALDATYEMYCGANRVGAGLFEVKTF